PVGAGVRGVLLHHEFGEVVEQPIALLLADLLLAPDDAEHEAHLNDGETRRVRHRRHLSICSALWELFTHISMPSVTRFPTHLSMSSFSDERSSSLRFWMRAGSVMPSLFSFTSTFLSTTSSQSARVAFRPQPSIVGTMAIDATSDHLIGETHA